MLSLSSPKALESTNGRTQKFDFDSSPDVFFSENFIEAYIDEINEKTQQLMFEERKKRKNSNRSRSSIPTRHSMISFNQITSQSFLQTTAVKSAMHLKASVNQPESTADIDLSVFQEDAHPKEIIDTSTTQRCCHSNGDIGSSEPTFFVVPLPEPIFVNEISFTEDKSETDNAFTEGFVIVCPAPDNSCVCTDNYKAFNKTLASSSRENQRAAQKWLSQKASGVSPPQKLNSKTSVIGPFEFFELIKNKGLQVIKHPRKGNPRKMFIRMSRKDSEKSLVWRGRSFLKRRFDLASANNIQKGFTTSIFQRTGDPTQDGRYVSIENSQRMLCLEMSSEIERNNFVKLVEFLAKGHSPIEQISLQTNSNPQLKITYNSKNASG